MCLSHNYTHHIHIIFSLLGQSIPNNLWGNLLQERKAFNITIPSKKNNHPPTLQERKAATSQQATLNSSWLHVAATPGLPQRSRSYLGFGGIPLRCREGICHFLRSIFFQRHHDFGRFTLGQKHLGKLAIVHSFESLLFQICPPI